MSLEDIKKITNIGAGTMGHAITLQFALKGYPVNLLDMTEDALKNGLEKIESNLRTYVKAGIITKNEIPAIMARISITTDYPDALTGADFVIESVVESMDVKKMVWQKIENLVKPQTILATNTSGLSPTEIAQYLNKPERFLVAHFYNPAHLMPLVEVVPAQKTDPHVVQTTVDLMNHIGKHAVALKKEAPGFVGNRIQAAIIRECLSIIQQDIASPETIDDIVKYSLGLRYSILGPIASADLGGLDTFNIIIGYLTHEISNAVGENPLLAQKVKEGKLGQKTGEGFYDWTGEQGKETIKYRDEQLLRALARENKN